MGAVYDGEINKRRDGEMLFQRRSQSFGKMWSFEGLVVYFSFFFFQYITYSRMMVDVNDFVPVCRPKSHKTYSDTNAYDYLEIRGNLIPIPIHGKFQHSLKRIVLHMSI